VDNTKKLKVESEEKKKAQKLMAIYDDCIIGVNEHKYIYSAECIIDKLYEDFIKAIENHEIDLYDINDSIKQSAYTYAVEHFEFNFVNCIGKYYPIHKYKHEA